MGLLKDIPELRTPPIRDIIYERLRKAIVQGELKADSYFNDHEISEEFGVSRTPIREAVQKLESDGYIERVPMKGYRVCGLSTHELAHCFSIRKALETLAVRYSALYMGTAAQVAQRFRDEKVAIAIGIATPTAQALANAIRDRPVIYSAVTDPVAAGLVPSLAKGGRNVTGTSDMTPVRRQLEFLLSLKPIKRLGHVYNSGEANSVRLAELVAAFCKEKGIALVSATVTNSAEVKQATLSIAGRVDAIYLGNDNTVFSAINAVSDVAVQRKLPLVTGDPSSAETGVPVLAALGFDYYAMGRATGKIALRVLAGEKTENIPCELSTDPKDFLLVLNKDTAAKIGLVLPPAALARASALIEGNILKRK